MKNKLIYIGLIVFLVFFVSNIAFAGESSKVENKVDVNKSDDISSKYGFTLQEEKEIGFQSAVILAKRYGYYNNDKVNKYVQRIGNAIAEKVSKRPDVEYSFYVLDTPEINAFAVPGGFIFITKGALKIMANEAELVGVLSHEVAHVELGHGLEAIASNPRIRERIRIMKVNLQEGKGFTQQSLRSLLSKEKNITSGIVNSGSKKELQNLYVNDNGEFILEE